MNRRLLHAGSVEGKYAVIGDVENSRKNLNKRELRLKLTSSLKYINTRFREDICIPFEMYKGIDEIGGVVSSPDNLYAIFDYLNTGIYPSRIRIVAVNARFEIYEQSAKASHLDGEAFHLATEKMIHLKRKKRYFEIDSGKQRKKNFDDLAINQIINLVQVIKYKMTKRQWEIGLLAKRNLNSKGQAMIAKKLHISQQAVSDALNSSNYYEVSDAETLVNAMLGKLNKG